MGNFVEVCTSLTSSGGGGARSKENQIQLNGEINKRAHPDTSQRKHQIEEALKQIEEWEEINSPTRRRGASVEFNYLNRGFLNQDAIAGATKEHEGQDTHHPIVRRSVTL